MPYVGTSTSTASFDKQVQTLIQKTLYDELRGGLPHLPPGSVVPASFHGAGNGGNGTFRFERVKDLDATPASHLLTEGVPPAGQELDFGWEEFTAVQRGDFVRLTDLTVFESPLQLATVAAERIKTQMATIIDNRARELWAAGTNAIFSGTSNSHTGDVAVGDVLVSQDIKRAVAMLAGAGVPRINGCYIGIIHPYVVFDLELDDDAGGWIDAAKYGATQQLFNGEIGKYAGVRFAMDKGANVRVGQGTGSVRRSGDNRSDRGARRRF
jgi:N4-gp56 family major capsid protein